MSRVFEAREVSTLFIVSGVPGNTEWTNASFTPMSSYEDQLFNALIEPIDSMLAGEVLPDAENQPNPNRILRFRAQYHALDIWMQLRFQAVVKRLEACGLRVAMSTERRMSMVRCAIAFVASRLDFRLVPGDRLRPITYRSDQHSIEYDVATLLPHHGVWYGVSTPKVYNA